MKHFVIKFFLLLYCAMAAPVEAASTACDNVRPGWGGQHAGLLDEAVTLVFSPGGVMLLIMVPLAMRIQNLWFSLTIAVSALAIAGLNYYARIHSVGIDVDARLEGCIGEPWLAIGVFVLLSALTLIWQFIARKPPVRP